MSTLKMIYRQQLSPFEVCYTTHHNHKPHLNIRFIYESSRLHKPLIWRALLPVGVVTGACYFGYVLFRPPRENTTLSPKWQIEFYRSLPLRTASRMWGQFSEIALPPWVLTPMLRFYVWWSNVQLQDAAVQDLTQYKSINEFFRRKLRPGARIIDDDYVMTSPADGTVLNCGRVENGMLEQIKGINYSMRTFLGPNTWEINEKAIHTNVHDRTSTAEKDSVSSMRLNTLAAKNDESDGTHLRKEPTINYSHCDDSDEQMNNNDGICVKPGHELFFWTVYLAPGDYHCFHSPAQWTVKYRRHFPGDLLSVNPLVLKRIKGLFNYNERAVYYGTWQYGFFSFAAVGATSVGSINVYCDSDLKTNEHREVDDNNFYDKTMLHNEAVSLAKGEIFGEFNFGSSLVIIFEAPKNFKFSVNDGGKVQVGQAVGRAET